LFYYLIFNDFIKYSDWERTWLGSEEKYENFLKNTKWKNYINDNQKIFLVREFVITPDMKVNWVVLLNWKKKNFKNKSLDDLKKYNPEKVYITKIWEITLKGFIEINDLWANNKIIYSNIEEKNKKDNK